MARIIIADDDELQISLVRLALEPAGHIVGALLDGEQVVDVIAHKNPELLILDCAMPKKSGVEVLREIRARIGSFPVLMLTGRSNRRDIALASAAGADDYMTKPFDPIELQIRVEGLLKKYVRHPA